MPKDHPPETFPDSSEVVRLCAFRQYDDGSASKDWPGSTAFVGSELPCLMGLMYGDVERGRVVCIYWVFTESSVR